MTIDGLDLVAARPLLEPALEVRFPLVPGDRLLVGVGDIVAVGAPLAERALGARVEEADVGAGATARPGDRWRGPATGGIRRRGATIDGELMAPISATGQRWRVIVADQWQNVESPVAGRVLEARPGVIIRLEVAGRALRAAQTAGSAARGRLELGTDSGGELRSGGIDVGRAGTVLVVGARVDAEALTRARAMGVRGIVVAGLAGKDLRDFLASERRQRSGLHPTLPFGVLVLDGALRRPIAGPVMELLTALAGREVAIVTDPPALVFDEPDLVLPPLVTDRVRVRSGPLTGSEGSFVGLAGTRRFEAGTHLEAGWVRLGDEPPVALPLSDLERLT